MLELRAHHAERDFDVELAVGPQERVAVLGPNGAGKSTLLAIASGLLRPDAGKITLDDRVLVDCADGRPARWVPPHDRGIVLMAQQPLLFPYMSVLENVAFGPRSSGERRRASHDVARHWLSEVDAIELADRRPGQLSGGQAQRVAIARALAANPRLLLLDEPMAALDVKTAPVLRQVLRRVLAGRQTIVVTHDVLDALMLSDRVVVLDGGRVVESGPTESVLAMPRSAFAAQLAGLNVMSGVARGAGVVTEDGTHVTGVPGSDIEDGSAAIAAFRPNAVSVFREPPAGSPRNVLPVTITELLPRGNQVHVCAGQLTADIMATSVAELDLVPGSDVFFSVKATEVTIYPG